jgi:hypothetical protein
MITIRFSGGEQGVFFLSVAQRKGLNGIVGLLSGVKIESSVGERRNSFKTAMR